MGKSPFCWKGKRFIFLILLGLGLAAILISPSPDSRILIESKDAYAWDGPRPKTSPKPVVSPFDIEKEELGNRGYLYINPEIRETKAPRPKPMPKPVIPEAKPRRPKPIPKVVIQKPKQLRPKPMPEKKEVVKTRIEGKPTNLKIAIKMLTEAKQKTRLLYRQVVILKNQLSGTLEKLAKARATTEEAKLRMKELEEALARVSKTTQTYIVKKDESLSIIAAKEEVYGDGHKWLWLYHANRDQIYDPNLIFPDMVLLIPRFEEPLGESKTTKESQ